MVRENIQRHIVATPKGTVASEWPRSSIVVPTHNEVAILPATHQVSFLVFAPMVVLKTLVYGDLARSHQSLMVVVLFLGRMQLIFSGIIDENRSRQFVAAWGTPANAEVEVGTAPLARSQ